MFLRRDSLPVQVREDNVPAKPKDLSLNNQGSWKPADNEILKESTVRIPISELRELRQSSAPILILDVRRDRNFDSSVFQAQGALRISADQAVQRVAELQIPRQTWLIAFCA